MSIPTTFKCLYKKKKKVAKCMYEHDIENFAALFKSVHSTLVLSLNKQFQSHVVKTPPLPSNIVMNAFNYLQIRFAQRRKDANNR